MRGFESLQSLQFKNGVMANYIIESKTGYVAVKALKKNGKIHRIVPKHCWVGIYYTKPKLFSSKEEALLAKTKIHNSKNWKITKVEDIVVWLPQP